MASSHRSSLSKTASSPARSVKSATSTPAAKPAALDPNNPDTTVIDMETLGQLLDMDDDDTHSFSKPLIEEYTQQADATLKEIEAQMVEDGTTRAERLELLSSKGHFLKGSSAALGVIKVRDSCEALQNLGKRKDASGAEDISEDDAWQQCSVLLPRLRAEQDQATKWLAVLSGFSR